MYVYLYIDIYLKLHIYLYIYISIYLYIYIKPPINIKPPTILTHVPSSVQLNTSHVIYGFYTFCYTSIILKSFLNKTKLF